MGAGDLAISSSDPRPAQEAYANDRPRPSDMSWLIHKLRTPPRRVLRPIQPVGREAASFNLRDLEIAKSSGQAPERKGFSQVFKNGGEQMSAASPCQVCCSHHFCPSPRVPLE